MKQRINYLFWVFLALLLFSCSKDEVIQTDTVFMKNGSAQILDEQMTQYITSLDSSYMKLSISTPERYIPQEGNVICCKITNNTPYGFLGRVTNVKQDKDAIWVKTEQVALDEAFENLSCSGSFDLTENVDSVLDVDGNLIDFEIVDDDVWNSLLADSNDINSVNLLNINSNKKASTRASRSLTIAIPIKYKSSSDAKLSFVGTAYVKIGSNFDIQINNFSLGYLNVELTPQVGLTSSFSLSVSGAYNFGEDKPIKIPLGKYPVGPIVLCPVLTLAMYPGVSGEAKLESNISYEAMNTTYYTRYSNGVWSNGSVDNTVKNGNWIQAASLELSGEAYVKAKAGVLIGLFSANTFGIGLNAVAKASTKASFKLSADNLLKDPVSVQNSLSISGELYVLAKFFGKNFGKQAATAELTVASREYGLLPKCENMTAVNEGDKAMINVGFYPSCFLVSDYGVALMDKNREVIQRNKLGTGYMSVLNIVGRNYNTSFSGLSSGSSYKVAPYVNFLNYYWYGEEQDLTTAGSFTLCMRCASQTYDAFIHSFEFDVSRDNSFSTIQEGYDYGGSAMQFRVNAKYSASDRLLKGTVVMYFYDDPAGIREDAFTLDLSSGDSGYCTCMKVVDNGGCVNAARIYSNSSLRIKGENLKYNVSDYECSENYHPNHKK